MKRSDVFTLFILFLMLGATVSSIAAAGWMPGLEIAAWAMLLGLLAGTALAFSNFTEWMAHVTSFIYGLFVLGVIGGTRPDISPQLDWRERVYIIFEKIVAWARQALNNGTSRESLIFVLLMCALFWLLSYTAAWYSFRHRRIWHVLLPTGVTLFANIYYYMGDVPMQPYLIVYLVCALILLVESHLADREERWQRERVRFAKGLHFSFTVAGVGIAMVALLFAWRVPEIAASETATGVFHQLNTPYTELLARWNRLFSTLQNVNPQPVDSYNASLVLGGPRHLTTDPVMDVTAPPRRYYWRAVSYDHYDGTTWTNTINTTKELGANDTSLSATAYQDRVIISPSFNMYRGTNSIYSPSVPQSASVPAQGIYQSTDDGTVDIVQMKLASPLLPGNRYSAAGSLSVADAEALRNAPLSYPDWIARTYLQLPSDIPREVTQLASNITADQETAYDKAAAIEQWLRTNIAYDENLEAPPAGVEGSYYILFRTKRAYCTYYSTAMVVMLRSLGVPARVVSGYAQGEIGSNASDLSTVVYSVKNKDSHAWVEVYFPQYGWIEFEPTAGQPAIQRTDSGQAATATPPPATATPRPTAQPTLSPNQTPVAPTQTPPQNPLSGLLNVLSSIGATLLKVLPFILGIVLLLAAGFFALRYAEGAGYGNLPPVQRTYAMLSRWATWLGIGQAHTPYEQAHELSQRAPGADFPTQTITQLYVANRFGAASPNPAQEQVAVSSWEKARRELHKTWLRLRWQRLTKRG
jgi:transglutaminase-like putative cysteine protease